MSRERPGYPAERSTVPLRHQLHPRARRRVPYLPRSFPKAESSLSFLFAAESTIFAIVCDPRTAPLTTLLAPEPTGFA